MASGSQTGDTSLWLHNKLGTSNDSWTGGSIVSQLTPEIFVKIQNCFQDLQPQVKLKLLLSLFHIPKRNLELWRRELESILDVAKEDSEPWVCMLAELMQTYPLTGQLNSDISVPESNKKIFSDLIADIKKALKKCSDYNDSVLPLECHYLNKNAFISVVGHQPQTVKHFTLKRKPKAAALRADLVIKSQEAANKVKSSSSGTFPVRKNTMPRRMDSTPMKGISNRVGAFRNSRTPIQPNRSKKEGGVKLLDINEQPMGYAAARKRKRQQEAEEKKEAAAAAAAASASSATAMTASSAASSSVSSVSTALSGVTSTLTLTSTAETTDNALNNNAKPANPEAPPDYAAGLASLNTSSATQATTVTNPPSYAPPTPAYAPPTPSVKAPPVNTSQPTVNFPASLSSLEPIPPTSNTIQPPPPPYGSGTTTTTSRILTVPGQIGDSQTRIVQLPTQPIPQSRVSQLSSRAALPVSILGTTTTVAQPRIVTPVTVRPVAQTPTPNIPTTTTTTTTPPAAATTAPAPRMSLTLTKEQMQEAMEMFRTANKVTRPEKALILGFMAGSRENPCPHLGNLVTIKLSENQDNVPQKDGTYLTMIIETHFQMNYSTGEWKRIKKYRRLEE